MKKLLISIITLLLLTSCNNSNLWNKNSENQVNKTDKIYTSIYPLYFITKNLVWNNNEVINIVPAWWEPHEYEPTPKQVKDMINSKLVILNWLWIEWYADKYIKTAGSWRDIIFLGQIWKLIQIKDNKKLEEKNDNNHDLVWNYDPHTWLSPKIMKQETIYLSEEIKNRFWIDIKLNTDKLITKLDSLDKKFTKELSNCKRDKIVTSHQAFAYLARDYWFTQFAVLWISPEEEPTAKDIANVVDLIKKEKLPIIFWEELVSPKFTDTIKRETKAEILNLNAIETLTPEQESKWDDYITLMEKNLEYLKKWLECK